MSTEQSWNRVLGQLRRDIGESDFRNWVKPLTLSGDETGSVRLIVPSPFMRDWVETHYADRIRTLLTQEDPHIHAVDFVVEDDHRKSGSGLSSGIGQAPFSSPGNVHAGVETLEAPSRTSAGTDANQVGMRASYDVLETVPAEPRRDTLSGLGDDALAETQNTLSIPLDPRFTFENFVVGKPNEFAYAAAKRVADSSAETVSFNPLFLYGGVGLGKTHMMHAIAHYVRKTTPNRRMLYLSAEKFMHLFIHALRRRDTLSFKDQFRSVDLLMVDDIQFISGKDNTQEEFFHTFNTLVDRGSQIVLSADRSPSDFEEIGARLRSRLASGLVADIHPTTYELRLGILESKAEQLQVRVPQNVLEFIAHKINSNGREVEGALIRLVAHAQLVGRPLSLETAQDVLHDLLRSYDRRVTVEDIQKKVCEHFNIRLNDMSSTRRTRTVVRPRQIAMYLAKILTSFSLPEIGRHFGNRDHTTVIHGIKTVEKLIETDRSFAEDVELLERMLKS